MIAVICTVDAVMSNLSVGFYIIPQQRDCFTFLPTVSNDYSLQGWTRMLYTFLDENRGLTSLLTCADTSRYHRRALTFTIFIDERWQSAWLFPCGQRGAAVCMYLPHVGAPRNVRWKHFFSEEYLTMSHAVAFGKYHRWERRHKHLRQSTWQSTMGYSRCWSRRWSLYHVSLQGRKLCSKMIDDVSNETMCSAHMRLVHIPFPMSVSPLRSVVSVTKSGWCHKSPCKGLFVHGSRSATNSGMINVLTD